MDNLNEMLLNMAPGPDGFPVAFYKKFWNLLGTQFTRLVNDFTLETIDVKGLNYGVLALIPRVQGVDCIRQFRHITLINVSFRLIAKGFTSRLAPVANKAIDQNQTAFIRGRSVLDGIVVLHEVLHEIRLSKEEVFILKIDSEKAYDRVRWDFLEEVLHKKGFDPLWVSYMRQLVRGGQTVVNINGEIGLFL